MLHVHLVCVSTLVQDTPACAPACSSGVCHHRSNQHDISARSSAAQSLQLTQLMTCLALQVVPPGQEPLPAEWQAQAAQLTAAARSAARSTAASAGLQVSLMHTLCIRGCVQLLLSFTAAQLPGEEEEKEEEQEKGDTGTANSGSSSAAAGVAGPTAGLVAEQVLQQLQAELAQVEGQVLVQVSSVHCSCRGSRLVYLCQLVVCLCDDNLAWSANRACQLLSEQETLPA